MDCKDLAASGYASKGEEAGKGGSLKHQEPKKKKVFREEKIFTDAVKAPSSSQHVL
jgi:hypothetical protein